MSKDRLLHGALALARRLIFTLYVIVPLGILLFAREPEITSTVMNHSSSTIFSLVIMMIVAWKGWKGFVPCCAASLGMLLYAMDGNLWRPPSTINLQGTVAVITGANSGLGKATALAMVRMGAHVVVTCRTLERCQDVVEKVNAAGKESGGSATAAVFNLSSLESAFVLSTQLTNEYPRIHYLFNNAGSTPIANLTQEGLEDGFGGMHLAHMALTLGLLPSLRNAGTLKSPSRVVMTSSEASITLALGFLGDDAFAPSFMEGDGEGDLRGEHTRGDGNGMTSHFAYGRAKLCNNLFAFEFNRRMQALGWPVVANTLHTGSVATKSAAKALGDLFQRIPGLSFIVREVYVPLLWRSPDAGARTLLYAALSDDKAVKQGGQYVDALCRPLLDEDNPTDSKVIQEKMKALRKADNQWAERLWNVSLRLLESSPARDVVEMAP